MTSLSYREIPLNGKKGKRKTVKIDAEDYDWIISHKWYLTGKYVSTSEYYGYKNGKPVIRQKMMHRMINNTPDGFLTDHINGDRLDNRRCNLRTVNAIQNSRNTSSHYKSSSPFKGVSFEKRTQMWSVQIHNNHKDIWLGRFHSEKEAAIAYNWAALKYQGQFAKLNIIKHKEE